MREATQNPALHCSWFYNDADIIDKIQKINAEAQQTREGVHKVHTYIEYGSSKMIEQNDIIVLNAYAYKYVEILIYMMQKVLNCICIHVTPDLNQYIIRATQSFS